MAKKKTDWKAPLETYLNSKVPKGFDVKVTVGGKGKSNTIEVSSSMPGNPYFHNSFIHQPALDTLSELGAHCSCSSYGERDKEGDGKFTAHSNIGFTFDGKGDDLLAGFRRLFNKHQKKHIADMEQVQAEWEKAREEDPDFPDDDLPDGACDIKQPKKKKEL